MTSKEIVMCLKEKELDFKQDNSYPILLYSSSVGSEKKLLFNPDNLIAEFNSKVKENSERMLKYFANFFRYTFGVYISGFTLEYEEPRIYKCYLIIKL